MNKSDRDSLESRQKILKKQISELQFVMNDITQEQEKLAKEEKYILESLKRLQQIHNTETVFIPHGINPEMFTEE